MGFTQSQENLDAFVGDSAVQQKLVTADQVKLAREEQARDLAEGRSPRPLGAILVGKGFLSDSDFVALLDAFRMRAARPPDPGKAPLGELLVSSGVCSRTQLQEALKAQDSLRARGRTTPRLGQILVDKGFATAEAVTYALGRQQKTILVCGTCGARANVYVYDPSRPYPCKQCSGELKPLTQFDQVTVNDSVHLDKATLESLQKPSAPSIPSASPFGKYVILRQVGKGGMAYVYEALDTSLNRRVALKLMIAKTYAVQAEAKMDDERFVREARLAAQLPKHPNIVSVYEAGIIEGRRYIAMEYVDGVAMSDWWGRESVTVRRKVEVLRDVARAVNLAHRNGVIHRDLKPENVLLDRDEVPHVTDFGMAKIAGGKGITLPGMVVGTPDYMSPEQAEGRKDADHRMDIYALGVTLFEIMTGRTPFEGATPMDILLSAQRDPVPPPTSIMKAGMNPVLYEGLERICLKAMAKEADRRYPQASDLADDLDLWLAGRPVEKPSDAQRLRLALAVGIPTLAALAVLVLLVGRGGSRGPITLALDRMEPVDGVLCLRDQMRLVVCTSGRVEGEAAVTAPGEYEIVVNASSPRVQGEHARFAVRLDGLPVGEPQTTAIEPKDYPIRVTLKRDVYKIGIEFLNDFSDPSIGVDRNLWLYAVTLKKLP